MTMRDLHRRDYRPEASGILDGVHILDLSRLFAGNVLTQMLGDFGAEVIKVEPPEGDTLRAWKTEGVETHWKIYARNKKSLCLSLRDPRPRHGLELQVGDSQAWTDLPAHGRGEVELDVPTERRGWLDLPRISLSSTQPLGLVRAWSWGWPEQPLRVHPVAEAVAQPLPEQGSDPLHTRAHASGEELHQLRPYRAGDPPRSIAWKHSARRDTLLVREYEKPVGIEVVLDWRALPTLPLEARISRLARWVDTAEREGRRYTLLLPGQPALGPGQGASHHYACLRALALMPHD